MAITFIGSATGYGTSSVAQFDITLPVCLEGDIVIVATGAGTAATSDLKEMGVVTSGYAEVADLYVEGAVTRDSNLSVSWKRMGETPDTVVTCVSLQGFGGAYTNGVAYVLRGVDPSTALDVSVTTASGTDTHAPDAPAITPATEGAFLVVCGHSVAYDASVTAPAGYTDQANATDASTLGGTLVVASKAWGGGGEEDPAAWTDWSTGSSYKAWTAVTLAFRPEVPLGLFVEIPAVTGVLQSGGALVVDIPAISALIEVNNDVILDAIFPAITASFRALGASGSLVVEIPPIEFAGRTSSPAWLDVTLPAITASFGGGGALAISLPPVESLFTGLMGATGALDINLPAVLFSAESGGALNITLPPVEALFTGQVNTTASLVVQIPAIAAVFEGKLANSAQLVVTLPVIQAAFTSHQQILGSLSVEFPPLSCLFSGSVGEVASLQVEIPPIEALFTGYDALTAEMLVTLPAIRALFEASQPGRFDTATAEQLNANVLRYVRPS